MFKFKFCVTAFALAVSTIAFGQEKTDFKADLFGQEATTVGEVAPVQAPHKQIINGTSPTDIGAAAAVAPKTIANVQAETNATPSEFQKFIAENTGQMLPMFGSEFFANAPSTFAPITRSAPATSS
jgi:hypothetical protein